MRKTIRAAGVLLAVLVLTDCGGRSAASTKHEAAPAASQATTGEPREYRAVCVQRDLHAGRDYVLSRWFDTRAEAKTIGDYHAEFKYKGHEVRIEERIKVKRAVPAERAR